jgi:hypothetical protein
MTLGDSPEQFAFHKNDRVRRKMGARILEEDGVVLDGWIDYEVDGPAARIRGEWYKIKWEGCTSNTREEFEAGELVKVVATFHGMTEYSGTGFLGHRFAVNLWAQGGPEPDDEQAEGPDGSRTREQQHARRGAAAG